MTVAHWQARSDHPDCHERLIKVDSRLFRLTVTRLPTERYQVDVTALTRDKQPRLNYNQTRGQVETVKHIFATDIPTRPAGLDLANKLARLLYWFA